MRKLLTCSTALSVALSSFHTLPSAAQTLAEDGSVIGPDGTVLCTPTAEAACDLDAITRALAARQAEAEAAAQAEADAKAAADAAAAEAAAQADADASAAADAAAAEAAAQAEADAKAAADAAAAEAAAQAEADAKAAADAAAAEAAAQADADAKAAADAAAAEAAAQAEAEAKAAADAAAAEAAAQAEADAKAAADAAAAEAAAQAEADAKAAADAAAAETAAQAEADAKAAADAAAAETAAQAEADAKAAADAKTAADAAAEAATADAAAEGEAAPVDVPLVSEEAATSLESILAEPTEAERSADPDTAVASDATAPALPAAAAAVAAGDHTGPASTGESPSADAEAPATTPAAEPVAVVEHLLTEDSVRSSDEEFADAPVAVAEGKKSGLSNLEKVGLLALGALVVGAVINEGRKDEKKVVSNTGDRVVVENPDGTYTIYKDDDAVLRRPGVRTVTETYGDGSTRTVVSREDGTQVVTVRDASGRVLRRSHFDRNGIEMVLIDDLYPEERIDITELPRPKPDRVTISTADNDAALKAELAALEAEGLGRKFSLRQIREIREVRALAATIEVDSITFDTGSSAIRATEARKLADIGRLMQEILAANPAEVFLVEGHTDAVGSAASNLALSDRRAESLALALTEYFDIPPENLVVQGYGEKELKILSDGDERANRRVVVRLITPLMRLAELR